MKMMIRMASAIALFAGSYALAAQEVSHLPVPPVSAAVSVLAVPAVALPTSEAPSAPIAQSVAMAQDPHEDPAPVTAKGSPALSETAQPQEQPLPTAASASAAAPAPLAIPSAEEPPPPSASETITIPTQKLADQPPALLESPVERGPATPSAPAETTLPQPPRPATSSGGLPEQRYANPVLVTTVQEKLTAMGYYRGPQDGLIGDQIRSAIKAFQRDHNMTPNGWVTTYLLAEIERVNEKPLEQHAPPVEMPVITPPPPPEISTWSVHDLLGKTAHAASGDRLGPVQDALIGSDGQVVQTYLQVNTLYGDPNGTSSVAWDLLNHNMALPVIMTRLGGVKASKIREMPQETPAEPGQWRVSLALDAPVLYKDEQAGRVKDMIFDRDGRLQRFIVSGTDDRCQMDIPVEQLSTDWAARQLAIQDSYLDECLKILFPEKTSLVIGREVYYQGQPAGVIRDMDLGPKQTIRSVTLAGRDDRCQVTVAPAMLAMDWHQSRLNLSPEFKDACFESLFPHQSSPSPLSTNP